MNKKLSIEGMSCNHCVKRVETVLLSLDGVLAVKVNLSSRSAVIETTTDFNDSVLFDAIDDAGYVLNKIELV